MTHPKISDQSFSNIQFNLLEQVLVQEILSNYQIIFNQTAGNTNGVNQPKQFFVYTW